MRYFLENFEKVYNSDWPFGYFPAWDWYESTGTHIGTDFKVPVGTPISAPVDGEMFKTFFHPYKGNVGIFVFKHQDVEWGLELCHLRELPQQGQFKEGEVIAHSGMTGEKVDGAHLHAVLHRDAQVTKHYALLKSREAFLKLEAEAALVDCFGWFEKNVKAQNELKLPVAIPVVIEAKATLTTTIEVTPPSLPPKVKSSPSFLGALFAAIGRFIASLRKGK